MKKVTKAVIPAAGLGTRVLPATKAMPKGMLPIVDKPAIQYLVEEAVKSGITDILIILGRNQSIIEDHFDRSPELEEKLAAPGKEKMLEECLGISNLANIFFVRQKQTLGLGHAVSMAKAFTGDDPFVVIYGDVEREVEARGGATLRNIREAVCAIRRAKLPDPGVLGNAGSFFKNPVVGADTAAGLLAEFPDMPHYPAPEGRVKLAAGWLIDRAGLKGHREGRVGVHERQALVLVNLGGATGGEVIAFARKVQEAVHARFGIAIDTEVNIL